MPDTPTGPFWDIVAGRSARPPAMDLLGFELLEVDLDAGTMRAAYDGRAEFANLAGHVQGGVLCAMLDSVMGSLVVATLDTGQWAPTLDLQAQFLSPDQVWQLARAVDDLREKKMINGLKLSTEDFQPVTAYQVSQKGLQFAEQMAQAIGGAIVDRFDQVLPHQFGQRLFGLHRMGVAVAVADQPGDEIVAGGALDGLLVKPWLAHHDERVRDALAAHRRVFLDRLM